MSLIETLAAELVAAAGGAGLADPELALAPAHRWTRRS